MNRIYQGRVVNAVLIDNGSTTWDWRAGLWSHHELFQDATNYYILCLAAMAKPGTGTAMSGLRAQLSSCWKPFNRAGRKFKGLRDSVAPYVSLDSSASIEDAYSAVLRGNNASPDLRHLAVEALAQDLGGEAATQKIQKQGRNFWPRFCQPKFRGTYPMEPLRREREAARQWIPPFLWGEGVTPEGVAAKLEVHHLANIIRDAEPVVADKARTYLAKAIGCFADKLSPGESERLQKIAKSFGGEFPRFHGASAKGADKKRLYAFLILKYLEQSATTLALLRSTYREPKLTNRSRSIKRASLKQPDFLAFGDDPIRLARGSSGRIFRAFTSLPAWAQAATEEICWSEFDIAAFKEALKTINQFRQQGERRSRLAAEIQNDLCRMDGAETCRDARSEDESEEESIPVLKPDPRFAVASRLLNDELAQTQYAVEGERIVYGLAPRTLRGLQDLQSKWNKLVKPGEPFSSEKWRRLIEITNEFQKEHAESIGSVTLFKALLEKDFWCLWQEPTDEEAAERQRRGYSNEFLYDFQIYLDKKSDIERLGEPIGFTPADADESRRLFTLSDVRPRVRHLANARNGQFSVQVSIAVREGAGWKERRCQLEYSAPRLRRDGLRRSSDEDLKNAAWLQPMLAAFDLPTGPQDFSKCAVVLMPDRTQRGEIRALLNFPVDIEPRFLQASIGKRDAWKDQFAASGRGTQTKRYYLRWPAQAGAASGREAWWDTDEFSCLAVDLGQRDAGAFAILKARRDSHTGRIIGTTPSGTWRAIPAAIGLLRLPGEDAKVLRNGRWVEELSGERGRMPTATECEEAAQILRTLGQDPERWLGYTPARISFPEQNDKLLVAARRAQAWLAHVHRWLWMLRDDTRRERALIEISEQDRMVSWLPLARERNTIRLDQELNAEITNLSSALPDQLVAIANRCLPLRAKRWAWTAHLAPGLGQKRHFLLEMVVAGDHRPHIAGQRGLSIERIEQIEQLRHRFLSLNRSLQRSPGARPPTAAQLRNDPVPDCCPQLLLKLDRIKEQRVNQTAHLIVAQALGVRLRLHSGDRAERDACDSHGEYERTPGRAPVDFIVLEDLSRYLSSQDRAPRENSRLMRWCHRQIFAKVIELSEALGIPILQTPAAYSSKFCSRTGVAGFRAIDVTPEMADSFPWKSKIEKETEARDGDKPVTELFAQLAAANHIEAKNRRCLIAPAVGGPLFVPARPMQGRTAPRPVQADINAAINIGLRAVAAPNVHDIHVRVRSHLHESQFFTRVETAREKARWVSRREIKMDERDRAGLARAGASPNFFFDAARVSHFDRATIDNVHGFASGRGLWKTVRDLEWDICRQINEARLRKWGVPPPIAAGAGRT